MRWNRRSLSHRLFSTVSSANSILISPEHQTLDSMYFFYEETEEVLFTENETNFQRLYGSKNSNAIPVNQALGLSPPDFLEGNPIPPKLGIGVSSAEPRSGLVLPSCSGNPG